MAIRLEAHYPSIELVDIIVDESTSTSAEITNIAAIQFADIDVSGVTSSKASAANIHFKRLAMAEAIYAQMQPAGIWTDADPKNRAITDLLNILDIAALQLSKKLTDTGSAYDYLYRRIGKGIFDDAEALDHLRMAMSIAKVDTASVYEEMILDTAKALGDTYAVADAAHWGITKSIVDTVTVEDSILVSKIFNLELLDTLTLDDESGFQMLMNRGKGSDDLAVGDSSAWQIGKRFTDTVIHFREHLDWALGKNILDEVQLQEMFSKELTRPVADDYSVLDHAEFTIGKLFLELVDVEDASRFEAALPKSDSYEVTDTFDRSVDFKRSPAHTVATFESINHIVTKPLADSITIQPLISLHPRLPKTDSVGMSDHSRLTLNWRFSDAVLLGETLRIDEPQYFGEQLGVLDAANIMHIVRGNAMANGMQLNQHTLG